MSRRPACPCGTEKRLLNKTDQYDSERLAQIMRTGYYRSVDVKSFDAYRARALLGARSQLVEMTTRLSNQTRGILKTIGLLPSGLRGLRFDRHVETLTANRKDVAPTIRPMLVVGRQLREQIAGFNKALTSHVKQDATCRRLMTVPDIESLSFLGFVSTVEDPDRFSSSRAMGAHLGLTPRQYQSGEIDRSGRISRCGDALARTLMYESAVVVLTGIKRDSSLKEWALAITRRSVAGKARVALARKLAEILLSIWRSGEIFRWTAAAAA